MKNYAALNVILYVKKNVILRSISKFQTFCKYFIPKTCKNIYVLLFFTAQRITTIQLDGVQYFISRMNPYSPELNYFLAYQYCR